MCNKPEVCFIGTSLCDKSVGNILSRQGCMIWNGEAVFFGAGCFSSGIFQSKE